MNVCDLLEAGKDATKKVELIARVALSECARDADCSAYLSALVTCLSEATPPFDTPSYAAMYHEAASDAKWLGISLITNAEREGDGAKRLWSLAACTDNVAIRAQLKAHAVDESRHALLYLTLLDHLFPDMVEPHFRVQLDSLSPHFVFSQELAPVPGSPYAKAATIDDFLQMNIAEIRTAIHHIFQRPAVAIHCSSAQFARVVAIQNSLLHDELRHVAYTAVLIDRYITEESPEWTAELFRRRVRDFSQITLDELGSTVFDCSVGCCERHTSCRAKGSSLVEIT